MNIPAKYSETGRRERQFFSTKGEAQTLCDQITTKLENYGTQARLLTPAQSEQALHAFEKLAPYRVTLSEAVSDWIARRTAADSSISFEAAMDAFMGWGRRSTSYVRSIRQTRNRLVSLHGKLLNTITPADLALALDPMPGSVRNFTIRILGGLFNFGIKRDYCAHNPCKKVDLAHRRPVEIDIYTPRDVAAIFAAVEAHDPQLVPFFAVAFFCGLRRSEALRLNWSAIDLHENFVKLPASITKTGQGRHVDISENCQAWLSPHTRDDGQLAPCTTDVLRKRLAALKAFHKIRTIKHGARHCFASYWLAKHGDINQLCRFLGHDDAQTTFKHYAKAATKRDAEKFWAIFPKAVPVKNLIELRKAV
ncbi:MAG: tyrosine-type recombinase/integrase [Chthoniobacteraceae bacterium]